MPCYVGKLETAFTPCFNTRDEKAYTSDLLLDFEPAALVCVCFEARLPAKAGHRNTSISAQAGRTSRKYGELLEMNQMGEVTYESLPVSASGEHRKFVNVGRSHVTDGRLAVGTVSVRIAGMDGFSDDGKLQRSGILCGMSKLFATLGLKPNHTFHFQILGASELLVTSPAGAIAFPASTPNEVASSAPCIFSANKLRPMHIERFQPENLRHWTPNAEVDVFMAFGVLQTMTGYRYCCGVNADLLRKLGFDVEPKPDAILIDDETDEYRIAEFEVYSSTFAKHNHKPEHVDVVVVWIDDETDKSKLPSRVVELRQIAKQWAIDDLGSEEDEG